MSPELGLFLLKEPAISTSISEHSNPINLIIIFPINFTSLYGILC